MQIQVSCKKSYLKYVVQRKPHGKRSKRENWLVSSVRVGLFSISLVRPQLGAWGIISAGPGHSSLVRKDRDFCIASEFSRKFESNEIDNEAISTHPIRLRA
jgi:hypothetical protein